MSASSVDAVANLVRRGGIVGAALGVGALAAGWLLFSWGNATGEAEGVCKLHVSLHPSSVQLDDSFWAV